MGINKKKRLLEAIFLSKEEVQRRERIRKRVSYKRWDNLLSKYKRTRNIEKILRDFHSFIDEIRGYGFAQTSYWYKESLEQVIEDRGKKK